MANEKGIYVCKMKVFEAELLTSVGVQRDSTSSQSAFSEPNISH